MDERPEGDRRGGIHVRRGDFRIRDFSLSFDRETGELVSSSMVTELRTDIFDDWLRIAESASEDAEAARRLALDADRDENEAFSHALEREFQASMIAVAAAAFAIDSFYASVLQQAPDTKVDAASRDASIFETLKRAFSLTAKQQKAARDPLRHLFRLRDEAVHPPAAWAEPVLHPVFSVGMEPRFIRYRAENAINAEHFARKLIAVCLRSPRAKHADLGGFGEKTGRGGS